MYEFTSYFFLVGRTSVYNDNCACDLAKTLKSQVMIFFTRVHAGAYWQVICAIIEFNDLKEKNKEALSQFLLEDAFVCHLSNRPQVSMVYKSNRPQVSMVYLQVNALGEWIIGIYLHEFTNNEREISIPHEATECGIEKFRVHC